MSSPTKKAKLAQKNAEPVDSGPADVDMEDDENDDVLYEDDEGIGN